MMKRFMMTPQEIDIARRTLGLRKRGGKARKNLYSYRKADIESVREMVQQGWMEQDDPFKLGQVRFRMSARGIDQFRLQFGE